MGKKVPIEKDMEDGRRTTFLDRVCVKCGLLLRCFVPIEFEKTMRWRRSAAKRAKGEASRSKRAEKVGVSVSALGLHGCARMGGKEFQSEIEYKAKKWNSRRRDEAIGAQRSQRSSPIRGINLARKSHMSQIRVTEREFGQKGEGRKNRTQSGL